MQKWEYTTLTQLEDDLLQDGVKIVSGKSWVWKAYLNWLGDQGWEMVSSSVTQTSKGAGGGVWFSMRDFFKRP